MTENLTTAVTDDAVEAAIRAWFDTPVDAVTWGARDRMRTALAAALPALMPTREAVAEVLRAHCGVQLDAEGVACTCGHRLDDAREAVWSVEVSDLHQADAVLALINPGTP